MALNTAALQLAASAIAGGITHITFHSDPPGAGDQNVISGGRFPVTLSASNGDITLSNPVEATGLTPLAEVKHVGFWSAASGGTFYGSAPRTTGDAAVNAAGEYTITSVSIPGTSS